MFFEAQRPKYLNTLKAQLNGRNRILWESFLRETEQSGVLYAFPPCAFSLDLLRRVAGDLSADGSQDDHLVVVVLRDRPIAQGLG